MRTISKGLRAHQRLVEAWSASLEGSHQRSESSRGLGFRFRVLLVGRRWLLLGALLLVFMAAVPARAGWLEFCEQGFMKECGEPMLKQMQGAYRKLGCCKKAGMTTCKLYTREHVIAGCIAGLNDHMLDPDSPIQWCSTVITNAGGVDVVGEGWCAKCFEKVWPSFVACPAGPQLPYEGPGIESIPEVPTRTPTGGPNRYSY